jgi:hypothetical protein
MIRIEGYVDFESRLEIEEVCDLISRHLLNGMPFGGKNEGYRDEVPALATQGEVFGCGFMVYGGPSFGHIEDANDQDAGYRLECYPGNFIHKLPLAEKGECLDIGSWIARHLALIGDFKITGYSPLK